MCAIVCYPDPKWSATVIWNIPESGELALKEIEKLLSWKLNAEIM